MALDPNSYEHLRTGEKEYIKQYITYDGSNRMQYVYEARANAAHGDPCLLTTYAYDGSSNRVQKMLESASTWDSSYDI